MKNRDWPAPFPTRLRLESQKDAKSKKASFMILLAF
jgi:hypothetical protein